MSACAHSGRGAEDRPPLRIRGIALIRAFDFLEQQMLASVLEGNKAAVHWRVRLRHNPTGEVHETELCDLWTIEGGRVVSLGQFSDTALAAEFMARA